VNQPAKRARVRGLTLIEVMIVMALMGLLTATLVFGSGAFIGASRRAAAGLFVAAVQKGLAQANTVGKPVRLAIDLGAGRLVLEESNSSVALRGKPSDPLETGDADAEAGAVQAAVAAAQAAGEDFLAYASAPSSGFTPIDLLGQDGDTPGRALDPSIKITKVQTEHDDEPISEGVAYIYFWPGGVTERAVVQLGRGLEDDGVTVEVSPLTGRARISRGKVDLPEPAGFGEDYSERDEL